MSQSAKYLFILIISSLVVLANANDESNAQATVLQASGEVASTIGLFRELLGPNNGGEPVSHAWGRREINWDGVPDELAAPSFLPADFFNGPDAPRARGAFLATPGDGVQVSADSDNAVGAAARFGHLNPSYADSFKTFSGERLFSPLTSNIVDLTFFVPGTDTPAVVSSFGAVYTDVDTDHTAFEYFDVQGNSLGQFAVPVENDGLSFLGVIFEEPIVARVRIAYGTAALGPNDSSTYDVAVMDDFIYAEPQALTVAGGN